MATQWSDLHPPVILVTGSSGLIGSRLVNALAGKYRVVGLDVKPASGTSKGEWLDCDLTNEESVRRALDTVSAKYGDRIASVVHLAAYYDFTGEPSDLYDKLTVEGTRRLIRLLKDFEFEVEQFIFSSSLLVMQPVKNGEIISEQSPTEATWDYPRSKLQAEEVIRQEHGEIPAVVLRIAGVYDEDGHSLPVGQQILRIYERQLESYFFPGNAEHGQAFIHLDDLVDCFAKTIERRRSLGPYEMTLVAEPDVMTYAELQEQIGEALHGKEWPAIRIPKVVAKAGAWVKDKLADEDEESFIKPWMVALADAHYPVRIDHARAVLGWEPRHRLRTTLPEILARLKRSPEQWYKKNGFSFDDDSKERPSDGDGSNEKRLADNDLDALAPPWDYNPSSWKQRIPICILAALATTIAAYMALYQWRIIDDVWDPIFGDQSRKVLDSDVSERMRQWIRIPDAALGAIGYFSEVVLGLAGSTRRWQYRPWMVILFGIDVIPLGLVSVALVILQGTVVGSWCFLCLVTALISLLLVFFAYDEVWSCLLYLHGIWKKTGSARVVWDAFWGRASSEANQVPLILEARRCGRASQKC